MTNKAPDRGVQESYLEVHLGHSWQQLWWGWGLHGSLHTRCSVNSCCHDQPTLYNPTLLARRPLARAGMKQSVFRHVFEDLY